MRGPRGQVRIENATNRRLIAAMQPHFRKMVSELIHSRHTVLAMYSIALQPIRDSKDELRRIIDEERLKAARYGRNRIARAMGEREVPGFDDPTQKMDAGPAVQMFVNRVYRDLARETYFSEDESEVETLDRIVDRIRRVLDSELLRLSRLNAAYGESFGAYYALTTFGADGKRWVTAHDEDVRESHAGLHMSVVPIYDEFENGLLYPGDVMHGGPGDWMNCRCWLVPANREEVAA